LGDPVASDSELLAQDWQTLLAQLAALQARLRNRDA
jgi:hypothetical protein